MRLIDADALITKLKNKYDLDKVGATVGFIALEIIIDIIDAPTVDPMLHAKWIPKYMGDCECSNCHEEYGICGGLLGDYKYCPNCGAKMKEEE